MVDTEGWRYPEASRTDTTETHHGQLVADPYRWLEDDSDPATMAWVAGQEELFAARRATWPRDGWHDALTRANAITVNSTPQIRGSRALLTRRGRGEEHPTLVVREGTVDRTLVSPVDLDPTGRTVLEAWHPSLEGDLVAVKLSAGGDEESFLQIVDVASGAVVDGPIDRVRRSPVAWLPGGRSFYYVRREAPELHPGEERYHRRVRLHHLGTDPQDDPEIFGAGQDPTRFYDVAVSADGRWLTITATTGTDPNTEVWLADLVATSPDRPLLRPVRSGVPARTTVHVRPGSGPICQALLRTDLAAPRGRIVTTTTADLTPTAWRELVAERPDAVLRDFAVLDGAELDRPLLLVTWSRHAISHLTIHDLGDGREIGTVPLPGSGTIGRLSVRPDGSHEAWFGYTDYTTPPTVLCFDGRSGQTRPWLAAGPDPTPGDVKTCQVTYRSHDGTEVGLFVVSPSGRPDRPRPTILTGYGGFGTSMTPGYLPQALVWASQGGVYAIACLRGGGEEGEEWHRAGMGVHKQNVFDDFAAAADHLVEAGWTTPDRLGIFGGSNGGLLVGAALTQHPEKFAAVACVAPLLDMVRYERFGLGPSWRSEYGTVEDPEAFRALFGYSPYHRVREGVAYPPVLLAVADSDTRVDPMHARKMCAALQHASTGSGSVLFRLERGVGHGRRATSAAIDLVTDIIAFLAHHLRIRPEPTP